MGSLGGDSNHWPIILDLESSSLKPPSPFKLKQDWFEDPYFLNAIKKAWGHINLEARKPTPVQFQRSMKL